MSSLEARTQEARSRIGAGAASVPSGSVFYTLDGIEHGGQVPPGADRWDVVARAVAARLRCEARADEPPAYDAGTRSWTLPVTLLGRRRGRAETFHVPVRW